MMEQTMSGSKELLKDQAQQYKGQMLSSRQIYRLIFLLAEVLDDTLGLDPKEGLCDAVKKIIMGAETIHLEGDAKVGFKVLKGALDGDIIFEAVADGIKFLILDVDYEDEWEDDVKEFVRVLEG